MFQQRDEFLKYTFRPCNLRARACDTRMSYERKTDIVYRNGTGRPPTADKLLPYSVRLPDSAIETLRASHIDPNRFCRDAILTALKQNKPIR